MGSLEFVSIQSTCALGDLEKADGESCWGHSGNMVSRGRCQVRAVCVYSAPSKTKTNQPKCPVGAGLRQHPLPWTRFEGPAEGRRASALRVF